VVDARAGLRDEIDDAVVQVHPGLAGQGPRLVGPIVVRDDLSVARDDELAVVQVAVAVDGPPIPSGVLEFAHEFGCWRQHAGRSRHDGVPFIACHLEPSRVLHASRHRLTVALRNAEESRRFRGRVLRAAWVFDCHAPLDAFQRRMELALQRRGFRILPAQAHDFAAHGAGARSYVKLVHHAWGVQVLAKIKPGLLLSPKAAQQAVWEAAREAQLAMLGVRPPPS